MKWNEIKGNEKEEKKNVSALISVGNNFYFSFFFFNQSDINNVNRIINLIQFLFWLFWYKIDWLKRTRSTFQFIFI